jgi:hypothetical protein
MVKIQAAVTSRRVDRFRNAWSLAIKTDYKRFGAVRSKAWIMDTGVVGSNLARGIDVWPRFSMLCCPVLLEALPRANPSSKESYQLSKNTVLKPPVRRRPRFCKTCGTTGTERKIYRTSVLWATKTCLIIWKSTLLPLKLHIVYSQSCIDIYQHKWTAYFRNASCSILVVFTYLAIPRLYGPQSPPSNASSIFFLLLTLQVCNSVLSSVTRFHPSSSLLFLQQYYWSNIS